MDSLLHGTGRPTTPSTPSPSERRRFISEDTPSTDHSLTRYRTFSSARNTHVESSAPSSPESSQYLSPKEQTLLSVSPLVPHVPLSNLGPLAHLGLVQYQRNALQSELQSQSSTNALQKESISSLRKLALRLAVRATVKDAHLERDAQTIGHLRKSEYLKSREYASAVVQLDSSIALHEHVMNELVALVDRSGEESASGNVLHQFRSCPTLPYAPLSPPLSPRGGQRTSLQLDRLSENEPSKVSTASTPQYNLLKAEQDSQAILLACRSRYDELEREITSARSREAFLRSSTVSLQDTVERQSRKLDNLESQRDKLQLDLEDVSARLKSSRLSEGQLQAALSKKASELNASIKAIEESKAEIAALDQSKSLMEMELQDTKKKLASSIAAWNDMSAAVAAKTEEITSLTKSSLINEAERQQLEKTKETLGEELRWHQSLIATLQAEKSGVELKLQNTRDLFDTTRNSHNSLKKDLESKVARVETLEADLRRLKKLEGVVLSHEERLQASSTQNAELEQSKAALDVLLHDSVTKRNRLETELTELRDSNLDLQAELVATEKTSNAFEQEAITLQQTKSDIEASLQNAEERLRSNALAEEKLRTDIESLQSLNITLQEQLLAAQSQLTTAQKSEKSIKTEVVRLNTAIDVMKETEQRLIGQLESSSSKAHSLETQYRTILEAHTALEQQFSAVTSELTAAKVSEKSIRQQLKQSQSLVSTHQENLQIMTGKIQGLKELNDSLVKRLQSSEDAKSLLQTEIMSINGTLEDITSAKNALGEQLEVSVSANSRLTQELSTTRSDLNEVLQSKEKLNETLVTSQSSHIRIAEEMSVLRLELDQRLQSEKQLTEQICTLEASKALIEDKLRITEAHNNTKTALHEEGIQQLRELTSRKSTVDEDLGSTRRRLQEAEESKEAINIQLLEMEAAKTGLEADLAHVRTRLDQTERSETELCLQLEIALEDKTAMELNFKSQLQDSDNAISRLQQKLRDSQETLTSAEASAAAVQAQLDATILEMADMERKLLAQLHEANANLRRSEQDSIATQSKLRSSKATEVSLRSQFKALEEDKTSMEAGFKTQLRALEDVAEHLRQELSGTEAKLNSTEELSRSLATEFEKSKSNNSAAIQELHENISELTLAKTDLEKDIDSIKAQLNSSQASEEDLIKQIEELKTNSDEVEQQLRVFLETTQNTTRITEEDLISKRTRLEMTELANNTLKEQLHEMSASKSQAERDLYALQLSSGELEGNLQKLKSQLMQAEVSESILKTKLQDSEIARAKLEANLTLTQQTLSSESARARKFEEALQEARNEHDKASIAAAQNLATHQKDTAARLEAAEIFQASLLQKSYAELEKSRADQDQLRALSNEISTLRTTTQTLRSALSATEAEITQLKSSLEHETAQKQQQIDQHLAETQRLRDAYADSQSKVTGLEARVREQEEEISRLRPVPKSRRRSIRPHRLFSPDFQVVHPSTPRPKMRREAFGAEKRRSVGGVDAWQSKLKEVFGRPFSSGSMFSHREDEGSVELTPTHSRNRSHNTLHKKPPVLKAENRFASGDESLSKPTTAQRFLDRISARPKTAPSL